MGPQPTALLLWSARVSAPQLPYLQTKYSCENISSQQLLQLHTSPLKGLHCFLLVSHSSFHCITLFTNQELSRTYFCQTLRKNVIPLAAFSKVVHYFFTLFFFFVTFLARQRLLALKIKLAKLMKIRKLKMGLFGG